MKQEQFFSWSPLLVLSCVLPQCMSQADDYIRARGILTFKPPILVLSLRQPKTPLTIKCTHSAAVAAHKPLLLQLTRLPLESGGEVEVLADSKDVRSGLIINTPINASIKVEGDYKTSLTVTTRNATCGFADFRYRCYSVVQRKDGALIRSEDFNTVGTQTETPRPVLKLLPKDPASLTEGKKLNLTCRVVLALATDTVPSEWVWERRTGVSWGSIASHSSTNQRGCFILGTSSHVTHIKVRDDTCKQDYRCYVAKGPRKFVETAGTYSILIVDCDVGSLHAPAVAVAALGTGIVVIGIMANVFVICVRRKYRPKGMIEIEVPQGMM
ncbi:hypothetical protein ACOMHN_054363 [Nucella lapillus]